MDRDWAYRAQQLRADIKLHESVLISNRYDDNMHIHTNNLLETERYLLAEAEYLASH